MIEEVPNLESPCRPNGEPKAAREYPYTWVYCFMANLPVPIFLAAVLNTGTVWFGIFLGTLFLCWSGFTFCLLVPYFSKWFVQGTLAVALTQFFPIAHFFAGVQGMRFAGMYRERFGEPTNEDDSLLALHGWVEGLIASVVTGGILVLLALFFAVLLHWLSGFHNNSKHRSRP